ncbi:MAG: hypothetical protein NVSMB49_28520 [Ktedonobacteraceae bacterium]
MKTKQAKHTAKEWVEANIEKWPGIRGAHLVGGITTMSDDALFPSYKDVDIHLIFEEGSPALSPTGPFLNLLETPYKGLLLEAGMKSMKEYESAEVVLSNPEIADHFTVDSVLYDPGGWLSTLREKVKSEFPRRKWVLARVDYERNGLKGALELVAMARNMGGDFVKGSIPGYTFTFIGAVLCVATLKPVTTGSRELLRVHEILAAYDQLDLYEGLLAILGVRNVSPERMEQLLQEGSEAFDLAVHVRRTPHPFQHKLHSHLKPYFIDSCKSLMDEGYHREAMAWLIPLYLAATDVIMVDGPDVEKPAFAARSSRLLRDMGMDTEEARIARMEQANTLYDQCFTLASDIIANHPDIVD